MSSTMLVLSLIERSHDDALARHDNCIRAAASATVPSNRDFALRNADRHWRRVIALDHVAVQLLNNGFGL